MHHLQENGVRNWKDEFRYREKRFFQRSIFRVWTEKNQKNDRKKPSELLRKRDKMYKELDLENNKNTDTQIIKLMIRYPGLILRPIIISKNKAYVGKMDATKIK